MSQGRKPPVAVNHQSSTFYATTFIDIKRDNQPKLSHRLGKMLFKVSKSINQEVDQRFLINIQSLQCELIAEYFITSWYDLAVSVPAFNFLFQKLTLVLMDFPLNTNPVNLAK